MDTQERWVTVAVAAKALGKSERTIRRWVADGKIPSDRTTPVLRVDIAGLTPAHATTTPDAASEVAALQAEIERLRAVLAEVREDRDYLRQALAASLSTDRQLTDGRPRRRFRWPWQRRGE